MESSFFNFGPSDNRPPATIRTRRPMVLRAIDGEPGHVDAGTEITVSAETLDQLDGDDFELIRHHRPDPPPMASFTVEWAPGQDVTLARTIAAVLR